MCKSLTHLPTAETNSAKPQAHFPALKLISHFITHILLSSQTQSLYIAHSSWISTPVFTQNTQPLKLLNSEVSCANCNQVDFEQQEGPQVSSSLHKNGCSQEKSSQRGRGEGVGGGWGGRKKVRPCPQPWFDDEGGRQEISTHLFRTFKNKAHRKSTRLTVLINIQSWRREVSLECQLFLSR